MGSAARRLVCLCLIGLGVVAAVPATAGAAVTLGSTHIDQTLSDFGLGCDSETCLFVQKSLPGAQVRAPFSGEILSWSVVSPGVHDYQLVVMRKRKSGKFKNVGVSSIGSTTGAGEYQFPAGLSMRKGDYIGLIGDSVQGIFNSQAKTLTFDPPVEFPDSRKPSFAGVNEYQFNASLQR